MTNKYLAYGIPVISSINLPAFARLSELNGHKPINVTVGKVPDKLANVPLVQKPFSTFNESEFLYTIPGVAKYYVSNGENIIIEPTCDSQEDILLYFYSNCMAAALFQRNLIPFHVSGVFIEENKVILFAAPSRTGKSTTSVMLQQKGYAPFTDDTAILSIENGQCFAYASYPMMRLWQNTIKEQSLLSDADKQLIRNNININKFGFSFHDQFVTEKVEVAGVVYLSAEGDHIRIKSLNMSDSIETLHKNVYRKQWLHGMKKQVLLFKHLTNIASAVPTWKAIRPKLIPTFKHFADTIEKEIIMPLKHNESILSE